MPLFLPLASVLPEGIALSTVDGLHITYEGVAVMHVAAQVTLIPKSGSQLDQSLDVPPTIPVDVRGRHMEAVWATPRHDERAIIVLANLSDTASSVQMTRPDRCRADRARTLAKCACCPKKLRVGHEAWTGRGSTAVSPAFARAASCCREPIGSRTCSGSTIRPRPRGPACGRTISASGTAAWPSRLKNTLDRPVQATASLLDSTDGHLLADLPLLMLGPHAGAALDVATAAAGARLSGSATLRVLASEGPGSLIGDLESVDSTTGLQRDGPLRDSGWDNTSYRRGTGNCAWRIDDDYTTHVVLTNVGEADTRYNVDLRSGAQDYVFEQQTLAQGATVTLDLRRIRDQRAAESDAPHAAAGRRARDVSLVDCRSAGHAELEPAPDGPRRDHESVPARQQHAHVLTPRGSRPAEAAPVFYGVRDETYARMFTRSSPLRFAATALMSGASSPFLVPFWRSSRLAGGRAAGPACGGLAVRVAEPCRARLRTPRIGNRHLRRDGIGPDGLARIRKS